MKKKIKLYRLEKFFPLKCPKCSKSFKFPGKDFDYYGDPNYMPNSSSKIIKNFPELYKTSKITEGVIEFKKRFDSGFILCKNCKNITFRIIYSSYDTYSKLKAKEFLKKGIFNSLTMGESFGTPEYFKETEGTVILSFTAKAELKSLLDELKIKKQQIKDIQNNERRFLELEEIDPILRDYVKNNIEDETQQDITDNLKKKFGMKWGTLEDSTKKFLITAESVLQALIAIQGVEEELDFSPVIIEFSKALEKELLVKFFLPLKSKQVKIDNISFQNYIQNDKDLTLGEMAHILKYFKKNISRLENQWNLLDKNQFFFVYNFPSKLDKFIYKFRNKSAHISLLTKNDCFECKKYLLEEPVRLLLHLNKQIV